MLTQLTNVQVWVEDQEEALAFYTEKLGMELREDVTVQEALDKLGFRVIADEGQLRDMVRRAIEAHPKAVADYRKGKLKAADALKGAVMRESKGMANTEVVQKLLLQELADSGAQP